MRLRQSLGFNINALQNMGTFSRELSAPGWGPSLNAGDLGSTITGTYDYKTNRETTTAANRFIPNVRAATDATITSYRSDGTSYTYAIKSGQPLVQRRFPLGRLNWIGPSGPQNGGTDAAIQACFGLKWKADTGMWQYVGPAGAAEQKAIKMLGDIALETPVREPNFFELLQAGILSGSLGLELHRNFGGAANGFNYYTDLQMSNTLQIFRIGASILSQCDPTACPIVVEFLSPANRPWQACGIDNLPYLNMFNCLVGADPASPNDNLAIYLMFGLWNPHQAPPSATLNRPPIRMHMQGQVTVANNYGRHLKASKGYARNPLSMPTFPYSYTTVLNDTVAIANTAADGVNGFVDAHALMPADLATTYSAGNATGSTWANLPLITGKQFVGYRLPNYVVDPTDNGAQDVVNDGPTILPATLWGTVWFAVNTDLSRPFNFYLEYRNPAGVWIPYNYHANINDSDFWFSKSPGFTGSALVQGSATTTPVLAQLDPPANTIACQHFPWEPADPRSLRFNYSQGATSLASPGWSSYLTSSVWSEGTETAKRTFGRQGQQIVEAFFAGPSNPATLSRNNTASPGTISTQAAYRDPDGVQRIGDSGLYPVASPATTGWVGDPYALSTTRSAERPWCSTGHLPVSPNSVTCHGMIRGGR